MAGIKVRRVTACPAEKRARVTRREAAKWPERLREIRSCCHCKTIYRTAGHAWRCEHWHEEERR